MPPPIGSSNSYRNWGAGSTTSKTVETQVKSPKRTDVTITREKNGTTTVQKDKQNTNKAGDTFYKEGKEKKVAAEKNGIEKSGTVTLAKTEEKVFVEKGAKEVRNQHDLAGGIKAETYYQGPSFKVSGDAKLTQKGLGADIDVSLKIDANLFKAGASAEKEFKFKVNGEEVSVKVKLGAEGQVGINGELKLKVHVGKDGISVSAGAEGFGGARGTLSGSLEVGINGSTAASGEIKLTAAAGAMGGAEFSAGKGKFHAKAYAAVGVGVGIEISGEINAQTALKGGAALVLPGSQGWK